MNIPCLTQDSQMLLDTVPSPLDALGADWQDTMVDPRHHAQMLREGASFDFLRTAPAAQTPRLRAS